MSKLKKKPTLIAVDAARHEEHLRLIRRVRELDGELYRRLLTWLEACADEAEAWQAFDGRYRTVLGSRSRVRRAAAKAGAR